LSNLLAERIRGILTINPQAPAIEYEGMWVDWQALASIAAGVESRLAAAGLGEGSPVGLILRNHPAMIGAMLGVLLADGCIVTINPSHGDSGLAEEIKSLALPAMVGVAADWQRPGIEMSAFGALGIMVSTDPVGVNVIDGLTDPGPGPFRSVPDGVAIEMLTSGTTGPPKRIPLSYSAFEHTVAAAREHYSSRDNAGLKLRSGVAIVSSPLVHMSGLFRTLLNICEGRQIALLERFRVPDFVDLMRRHRPRAVSLVPSALSMVLDAGVEPEVFSSVEVVTSGTAHLPVTVQDAFEERFDVAVLPSYGATEFAGGVAGWNLALHTEWGKTKRGSVGRAQRGRELRVMSLDDDTEVPPGVQGRVEIRTAGRDWVPTNDLGRIDADGFIFIDGRTDDVIVRGGFKIRPADLARVLRTHPAVRDAGVTGLPDDRLGQVPVAAVELSSGAAVTPEELLAYVRERVSRYQIPARLVIVDELPRTPSLKVSQPGMRELFEKEEM
jgi:acyl-CoA synthetase (AMP-forming)/AMP-acid ligase II